MQSFISYDADSDFSIYNIPFGVVLINGDLPSCATRVGDTVVDLSVLYERGYFESFNITENVFEGFVLNSFIELGKEITVPVREELQRLFCINSELHEDQETQQLAFHNISDVENLLPVHVPNYTDFYSSIEHATNVGKMFRDPENALLPNWRHIPVGYHGRASSIVVSGVDIVRPKGQQMPADAESPIFGPCKLLDFELELAFITNRYTEMGEAIPVNEAEDAIFGMVLFNDWSARDIQKWEYVPLGPFLGKNFGSSVSPWIVTLEAWEDFRLESPKQDPKPLPYLQVDGKRNIDINLSVAIAPNGENETTVCNSNFKFMYWNMAQQLAHHTVNGCNVEVGDMYASGTISGKDESAYGSMLELSWKGSKPLTLKDGSERKFIQDNDVVTMRGWNEKDGKRIGFGEVSTKILPAVD